MVSGWVGVCAVQSSYAAVLKSLSESRDYLTLRVLSAAESFGLEAAIGSTLHDNESVNSETMLSEMPFCGLE